MERTNGYLQRPHGSNQMNDMVRLVPLRVEQGVDTTTLQDQVVINLVLMNIILLTLLIIRRRNCRTMMGNNISAITALNTGIKERNSWGFTKHMDWNKCQTHTSSF